MSNEKPKFESAVLPEAKESRDSLTTICVRKPGNDRPVRVHSETSHSPRVWLMTFKTTGDPPVLVLPDVAAGMPDEPTIAPHRLYLCADELGRVFFWPVKDTNSTNSWQKSAHQLAAHAKTRWVRIAANTSTYRYEEAPCQTLSAEPSWPEKSLSELLAEAFGDDVIQQVDDSRITALRGSGSP